MNEIVVYFTINSKSGAIRIRDKMIDASKSIEYMPYSGVSVPDKKLSEQGYRIFFLSLNNSTEVNLLIDIQSNLKAKAVPAMNSGRKFLTSNKRLKP